MIVSLINQLSTNNSLVEPLNGQSATKQVCSEEFVQSQRQELPVQFSIGVILSSLLRSIEQYTQICVYIGDNNQKRLHIEFI